MRYILSLVLLPSLLLASDPSSLKPDTKKLSQTLGNQIGKTLTGPDLELDVESLIQGIREGSKGAPPPLTDEEYQQGMLALQEETFLKISKGNLEKAESFLKETGLKEGVISIENGKLLYRIEQQGLGAAVTSGSRPEIAFRGRFLNGEEFTSSDDVGTIVLDLKSTISGFAKGLEGMKEGEKRTLFIHPDLAYGTTGQLPPNSLLIFEIELKKADVPQPDLESTPSP